jgi:hypothetical protein
LNYGLSIWTAGFPPVIAFSRRRRLDKVSFDGASRIC